MWKSVLFTGETIQWTIRDLNIDVMKMNSTLLSIQILKRTAHKFEAGNLDEEVDDFLTFNVHESSVKKYPFI